MELEGEGPPLSCAASPTNRLHAWLHDNLPTLNGDALAGRLAVDHLVDVLNDAIPALPGPARCEPDEARRQIVVLGMIGSSAERHSQEAGRPAGEALARLRVGRWTFRKYLATLASRVGGPPRDTFQSFVIWNDADCSVYLPGSAVPCLTLRGLFPGLPGPLTFTGTAGERLFIGLLKRSAALEAAVNALLWPVCDGSLPVDGPDALERVDAASTLLRGLRAEMHAFRKREEFDAPLFLDGLRQYACAWEVDELSTPPSGAHDHEYVVRDILLGTPITGHDDHVDDLVHVLDRPAQAAVRRARGVAPLSDRLSRRLGFDLGTQLPTMTPRALSALVDAHPWVATYYWLYKANGDVSASHWAMVYTYMVSPMRRRDRDAVVVSNREGTGHMATARIRSFMGDRCKHVLFPLAGILEEPRTRTDAA